MTSVEMTPVEAARQIVKTTKRSEMTSAREEKKKKNSTKNLEIDHVDEEIYIGDTSWGEVCRTCFVHSPREWISIIGLTIALFGCLYVFGLGLDFLSSGAKVMAGCAAGSLFGGSVNPVAGVMVGILATVLLQSSSTTTSIVVGLVGAEGSIFTVEQGIYMIMGANIGTTVTNTIVSLLQFPNQKQLADAFAGATIHDIFNFLTVAILLPLEVLTGYLNHLTAALVRGANSEEGDSWEGPVKHIIAPLGSRILIANKAVTNAVAGGGTCDDFYPIGCEDPENPTYSTCETGLIGCDKSSGLCPAFFDPNAGVVDDQSAGLVVLCMGLFLCFIALVALVQILTRLLTGVSIRVIHKATALNGYVLILIGTGITTMLQSSSTTTSFLTPVVGIGALRLEQMYPLTIGANIGTTITAVLAAMVTDGNAALQVALAHFMFNITGTMIWYPIVSVRSIPIAFARRLGQYVRVWRPFALMYVFGTFFLMPLIGLGLSSLFLEGEKGYTVLGSLFTVFLGLLLVFWIRWCYFCGGRAKFYKYLSKKHERYVALQTLTTDMERIKTQVNYHFEYAGIAFRQHQPSASNMANLVTTEETAHARRGESVTPVDEYAMKKAKIDKQVQESVATVAEDMAYLKAGLAVLNHHTGLWADVNENEDDDSSTGSSEEDEEAHPHGVSVSEAANRLRSAEEEKVSLAGLWQVIPKVYVFTLVAALALMVWGIIALFHHGGKASIGAAYFMISEAVISIVWGGIVFNPTYVHQYFRNLDRARRQETIKALPKDMKMLKSQLRRLLQHYKLLDVDTLGSRNDNATQGSP
jgi:sodium-dependent phosphate cotransporter